MGMLSVKIYESECLSHGTVANGVWLQREVVEQIIAPS
jgi:hypothetical protein